jgi:TrmH family RNA methyltransferase
VKLITSRDNPRFRELKKLCHSGRERRRDARIVLDGLHLIEDYARRYGLPEDLIVSRTGAGREEIARFIERAGREPLILADGLFNELATVETPGGIMALAPRPPGAPAPDPAADAVLLDAIQDPGNLGSILRSAAAAGFRQILLSPGCAQAWSPKTLRAAMGAHFSLEIHEEADLPAFLAAYRGQSIVTEPAAEADLFAARLARPLAWIFGNEGQGVRPGLARQAARHLRIPMPGETESLNVAAAAAICLFETVRRRQTPGEEHSRLS